MNSRIITVRFNTKREKHNRAWEALQWLRREKGYTYSEALAEALISFVEEKNGNERAEETIAKDCAERIARQTEAILKLTIPAFFTGAMASAGPESLIRQAADGAAVSPTPQSPGSDVIPDDEIPWDYLGE